MKRFKLWIIRWLKIDGLQKQIQELRAENECRKAFDIVIVQGMNKLGGEVRPAIDGLHARLDKLTDELDGHRNLALHLIEASAARLNSQSEQIAALARDMRKQTAERELFLGGRRSDLQKFGDLIDSFQKQLDDLRRLVIVQEKPKVRVQAASFREVRQFIGEESD